MALTSNTLVKQVDLPVWEFLRPLPATPTSGLSATCIADTALFNEYSGRYQYVLINATNFWRYDTYSDTYLQMTSPPNAPLTASSMRFAGAQGYYNRVISATSTTFDSGLPSAQAAVGFKVRIVSGKGAGQERLITAVSDPIVVDSGGATGGSTTTLVDTLKWWTKSYTGTTANVNPYVGYMCRVLYGTGLNQTRKILYHTLNTLTIGDTNYIQNDPFANVTWTAPAAGSSYQIEYNTITIDTAWDVIPDSTSRFVIQSGAIWLLSGASATPFHTIQYYDVLHDLWYTKPAHTQIMAAAPTEVSLERMTENSSLWYQGRATDGSTATIVDSTANWTTDQWNGYHAYIYSGPGRGQVSTINSNTNNTLNINAVTTATSSTSLYQIIGYDAGTSSGSNTYNTFNDSTKTWTTDRWKNYSIRILYGTGSGQLRSILSNTTSTLTLYRGWNILPDASSVYAIQGDSEQNYIAWGGVGEIFIHNAGNIDIPTHTRITDQGIVCLGAAWLSDANHTIYEQMPVAITSLSGTTTITATTVQNHNFLVGQYVSIRGVTNGNDQFNVTGLVQILSVPSTTTFTYTPNAAGSGSYTFGATALSTTVLTDGSKDYRDNLTLGTTTQLTFPRITPSNLNGWYVSGTNILGGTRVSSGAGSTTLTLSQTQVSTASGIIMFSPWAPAANFTATGSGGGTGVATVTLSANSPANCNGWYISGNGITVNTKVFSGQGTTSLVLTNACSGAVSGTVTLTPPEAAGKLVYYNSAAPAVTTGAAAAQCGFVSAVTTGVSLTMVGAAAVAPTAAVSRYAIGLVQMPGAKIESQNLSYYSGVLLGAQQSTTAAQDTNAFWATATGSAASAGLTTVTLSAASPGSVNGWFISGTGITTGTYIVSGAGTTSITLSQPTSGAVSGTMTCTAWNAAVVGRRLKFHSSTGISQDVVITGTTATIGALVFGTATAGAAGTTAYSIYSIPAHGAGCELVWVSSNTDPLTKGRYLWMPRCGGSAGIDILDLNTDEVVLNYYVPFAETMTTGSSFAYDQEDRIYFTVNNSLRFYYLDVNTRILNGAGFAPYITGTALLGNRTDIFTTTDNLKYLIFNRHTSTEVYRQLLFY